MEIVNQIKQRRKSMSELLNISKKQEKLIIKVQARWRGYLQRAQFKKILNKKKKKYYTAFQLLSTQRDYCQHLKFIVRDVVGPAKTFLNNDELHLLIFGNLPQILLLHQQFLSYLQKQMNNYHHHLSKLSQPILNKLLKRQQFKKLYTCYCANYGKADQNAKIVVNNNAKFREHLKKIGLSSSGHTLQSYLIKPVQRICKYQLLITQYLKNTQPDHIDAQALSQAIVCAQKMVSETNNDVEQFLYRQKYLQLQSQYSQIFRTYPNPNRKILFEIDDIISLNLIKQDQSIFKQIIVFNDGILLLGQKPIFSIPLVVRQLPNLKYFKNLVQIIDQKTYYTLEFKKLKKKQNFLNKIYQHLPRKLNFVYVRILGTQNRQSLFKTYTVYIVQIKKGQNGKPSAIYPRFKQLIKIQDFLKSKNIVTRAPYLHRQSLLSTLKSKTIQKRKLLIQQFLQRILNLPQSKNVQQVWTMLGVSILKQNNQIPQSVRSQEVKILLPNNQHIAVRVNIKSDKIIDLKKLVAIGIGLVNDGQFQIFQVRGKVKRLMYDQQPVSKIYQQQDSILSSINPFKQQITYLYSRHFYLSNQQEYSIYKQDFVRTQLELAVIRSQILCYRLQEQLMITFMCLFALYANLPLNDQNRIISFLKDIGQKQYKVSVSDFKIYLAEVQKMVAVQQDQFITLPFLIIKIMNNSSLYQVQQFEIQIHQKSYKDLSKYIPGIQQHLVLGVKKTGIMLMTIANKHIIQSFSYDFIEINEMHPTAMVLKIQNIPTPIRLLTSQGYQISLLMDYYKGKKKGLRKQSII